MTDEHPDRDQDWDNGTGKNSDEDRALRALRELVSNGQWQPTPGGPTLQVYVRPWPDNSADSLMIGDAQTAYAERVNHHGEPVWQRVGTVTELVAALRRLPAPDAPDAPRTVLPPGDTTDRDM